LDLGKADAPRRVMAAAFAWVGSRTYRPRFEQLRDTVAQARKGATVTLGGCLLSATDGGAVRMTREAAATTPTLRKSDAVHEVQGAFWDKRWFLEGPLVQDFEFKALGEGIKNCPNWRESGMPRTSLLSSPSVWQNDTLIAAPLAGLSNGWAARIVANFHSSAFAIED
jgi:tRNA(Ile)-lysidine synthase